MGNYIKFYDNLVVHSLKVERDPIPNSLVAAKNKMNKLDFSTVLQNSFTSFGESDVDSRGNLLNAYYFDPNTEYTENIATVYRKSYKQPYYNYLCTLYGDSDFLDYNIHNNDNYDYLIFLGVLTGGGAEEEARYVYRVYEQRTPEGDPEYIKTKWDTWSICNIQPIETSRGVHFQKTGNVWLLGANLQDVTLTQNLSAQASPTLGKFPKIVSQNQDYVSSTFTGLLGTMQEVKTKKDDEIISKYKYTEKMDSQDILGRETEKFQEWLQFCSDGELKLLKDIKGNSWVVQIVSTPTYNINPGFDSMPTEISFDWVEVMDVNNLIIVNK